MLQSRWLQDEAIEAGIDEAGRGCFWGPLYAGAVIWPDEDDWCEEIRENIKWIKDSKKLGEKRRQKMAELIQRNAIDSSVGIVEAHEINGWGVTASNQLAFTRALEGLVHTKPDRILVDGSLRIPDKDNIEQITIIDGDALYIPIAAASILAKTGRDNYVKEWCASLDNVEIANRYGLISNKGYGTASHRAGLKEYGSVEGHRTKFVRNWIPSQTI
jgi:ribonuclease HII